MLRIPYARDRLLLKILTGPYNYSRRLNVESSSFDVNNKIDVKDLKFDCKKIAYNRFMLLDYYNMETSIGRELFKLWVE